MEPDNEKQDAGSEPSQAGNDVAAPMPDAVTEPRIASPRLTEQKFAQLSRRELLKLVPVLALGAFAIPTVQELLLKKGQGFSDWAAARMFRGGHLAPTFADAEVTPFEKF